MEQALLNFQQGLFFRKTKKQILYHNSTGSGRLIPESDRSGNLTGTQTAGTNIDMARGSVHNCLYALHIGLPRTIAPSVGVGNTNTKSNTLVAKFTFSHPLHLLAVTNSILAYTSLLIIPELFIKSKNNFLKKSKK